MDFGIFLLLRSPSARPTPKIYARGIEIAQAAEALGFRTVWLAEHHYILFNVVLWGLCRLGFR